MIEDLDQIQISQVDRDWLERTFKEEEIRRIVFWLEEDKPLGLSMVSLLSFIRFFWNTIKIDLIKGFEDFFLAWYGR